MNNTTPNQTRTPKPFDHERFDALVADRPTTIVVMWAGATLTYDAFVRPNSALRDAYLNPHVVGKDIPPSYITDECPRCGDPLEREVGKDGDTYHTCCGYAVHHEAWLRYANTRDAEPNPYSPPAESDSVAREFEDIDDDEPAFEDIDDDEPTQPALVFDPMTGLMVPMDTKEDYE